MLLQIAFDWNGRTKYVCQLQMCEEVVSSASKYHICALISLFFFLVFFFLFDYYYGAGLGVKRGLRSAVGNSVSVLEELSLEKSCRTYLSNKFNMLNERKFRIFGLVRLESLSFTVCIDCTDCFCGHNKLVFCAATAET